MLHQTADNTFVTERERNIEGRSETRREKVRGKKIEEEGKRRCD